jgi:hypothetical protein
MQDSQLVRNALTQPNGHKSYKKAHWLRWGGQASLLQPIGLVVGISAAATDEEEQLPEGESLVVVPLEGLGGGRR